MNCGKKHDQASCPNCGSKLKKAGFWQKRSICRTEHLEAIENLYPPWNYRCLNHIAPRTFSSQNDWKDLENREKRVHIFPVLILILVILAETPLREQTRCHGTKNRKGSS
jgi:hypothetical protein